MKREWILIVLGVCVLVACLAVGCGPERRQQESQTLIVLAGDVAKQAESVLDAGKQLSGIGGNEKITQIAHGLILTAGLISASGEQVRLMGDAVNSTAKDAADALEKKDTQIGKLQSRLDSESRSLARWGVLVGIVICVVGAAAIYFGKCFKSAGFLFLIGGGLSTAALTYLKYERAFNIGFIIVSVLAAGMFLTYIAWRLQKLVKVNAAATDAVIDTPPPFESVTVTGSAGTDPATTTLAVNPMIAELTASLKSAQEKAGLVALGQAIRGKPVKK